MADEQQFPTIERLMAEAYEMWNSPPMKGMTYEDFLSELDGLHRKAVVAGNLNYQVENGGFDQWLANGYGVGSNELRNLTRKIQTETAMKVNEMILMVMARSARSSRFDKYDTEYYELKFKFMSDVESYLSGEAQKLAVVQSPIV